MRILKKRTINSLRDSEFGRTGFMEFCRIRRDSVFGAYLQLWACVPNLPGFQSHGFFLCELYVFFRYQLCFESHTSNTSLLVDSGYRARLNIHICPKQHLYVSTSSLKTCFKISRLIFF